MAVQETESDLVDLSLALASAQAVTFYVMNSDASVATGFAGHYGYGPRHGFTSSTGHRRSGTGTGWTDVNERAPYFPFAENYGERLWNLNTGIWLCVAGNPSVRSLAKFTAPQFVLDPQDEGGFVAYSNEYPGAIGQGETEDEAIRDLQEAISVLKDFLKEEEQTKKTR